MKEKKQRDLHRDLRRQCDRLAGSGTGICLFGVWSIIKVILNVIQERHNIPIDDELPPWAIYLTACIVVLIICLISFTWYLFIGLSARSVALKGKKHILYTIVSAVFALIIVQSDVYGMMHFKDSFETFDVFIVEIIIDMGLVIALIEIIISNAIVMHLRRKIRKQEVSANES